MKICTHTCWSFVDASLPFREMETHLRRVSDPHLMAALDDRSGFVFALGLRNLHRFPQ
jgi:hypothetical protein